VTVFERADRIGGLLRYGIPDFKMEKRHLDRRMAQMEAEGVTFRPGVNIGVDLPADRLLAEFDAVCLCGGATAPRDLKIPGRDLDGVHFAMDFLPLQNKRVAGRPIPDARFISAEGKHVIIIGGGDTGADCLGTVASPGGASVHQFEIVPRRPTAGSRPTPGRSGRSSPLLCHESVRVYSIYTRRY
jgi:glutamate synthase (NADPH/NADH) small chain